MVPATVDFTAVRRALVARERHHGNVFLVSPGFAVRRVPLPRD